MQTMRAAHENGLGMANEVLQQLNQSAPDAQSVHIVTMEVACQQLYHTYQEMGGWTHY